MSRDEIYSICVSVDSFIAKELTESIVRGISYDILEANYGILPISRRSFYRRKATVQRLMRQQALNNEENGKGMENKYIY